MWYVVIGFLITVIVGLIVSWIKNLVDREEPKKMNPALFSPLISRHVKKHLGERVSRRFTIFRVKHHVIFFFFTRCTCSIISCYYYLNACELLITGLFLSGL